MALSSLIAINRYITLLYEAEENAEITGEEPDYPPFPKTELRASVKVGCVNACIDWATQMLRSVLDWIAAENLGLPLSRRIRKDLRASALRKDHYTFYSRMPRVARTSLFSESTLYLADYVITCCFEVYNALLKKPTTAEIIQAHGVIYPRKTKLRLLAIRCGLQAGRCTAVWLAISAGNGIGSAAPTKFRGMVMFLCTQLAGMGTNLYANAFIARFTAGAAPPPGPPPIVGPPQPPVFALAPPGDAGVEGVLENEQGIDGEAVEEAAMHALHDLLGNFHLPQIHQAPHEVEIQPEAAAAAPAPEAVFAAAGGEAPELPEAPQNQEARPRGGPRLPQRRPRRNMAVQAEGVEAGAGGGGAGAPAGGGQHVPGPDTPQSARDPPRVVAAEEDRAEREGAEAEEQQEVELDAVAAPRQDEIDVEAMPPATPPTVDESGPR